MALLKTSRTVDLYKTYLEDEDQVDQVYKYLQDVYENASQTTPCLARVDRVRLILDVLFPEVSMRMKGAAQDVAELAAASWYLVILLEPSSGEVPTVLVVIGHWGVSVRVKLACLCEFCTVHRVGWHL